MLTAVHPKLPMRDKQITRKYYLEQLGFRDAGAADYPNYLILEREQVQLHFFLFRELDPLENDGQVYIRTDDIDSLYKELLDKKVPVHPNAPLQVKPWGQKEFALMDPDNNLLTFGQAVIN